MLVILAFCVAPLSAALWIIVEAERSHTLLRVGLGLATIIAAAVVAFCLARFGPGLESGATRNSLRLTEQLLVKGEIQRVQGAVHAYNEISDQSTYRASFALWQTLNQDHEEAKASP